MGKQSGQRSWINRGLSVFLALVLTFTMAGSNLVPAAETVGTDEAAAETSDTEDIEVDSAAEEAATEAGESTGDGAAQEEAATEAGESTGEGAAQEEAATEVGESTGEGAAQEEASAEAGESTGEGAAQEEASAVSEESIRDSALQENTAASCTGTCGDAAVYTFYSSTGTLVISGSGAMNDFYSSSSIPWRAEGFYADITTVVIEEGITVIGEDAFYYCYNLTSVTIPGTVTRINAYAFNSCSSLTSVTIPDSVTAIESQAFADCTSLKSVTFGSGLVTIGAHAFYGCTSLASVTLPNSLTGIGTCAFYDTAITSVTIPAAVTSMGTYAFPDGTSITYANKLSAGGSSLSSTGYSGAVTSDTIHENNYFEWSDVVNTYLFEGADGYIYRVEFLEEDDENGIATGEGSLFIEKYTTSYKFVKSFEIPMELSLFGGFYAGDDGYYVVFGQNNNSESDTKEVIRVVKYSTGLVRMGSASLCGINTREPFRHGSLSITEDDELLYVRTSRGMYVSSDGLSHQANLSFAINKEAMIVVESNGGAYVSHSFNQLITVDDDTGTVVAVDHGDAYPRSVYLTTYSAGSLDCSGSVELFDFYGATGANVTGASVGGLECSDTSYLVAFNSRAQDESSDDLGENGTSGHSEGTYNVYVSVVDKDDLSFKTVQLTSYKQGAAYSTTTPQLVKINDDLYAVMWELMKYNSWYECYFTSSCTSEVYIAFLDGDGNKIGSTQTITADLSECQPVVINGSVTWSVSGDIVTFYSFKAGRSGSSVSISSKKKTAVTTSLASAAVTLANTSCKYTGSAIKPGVTVTIGDTKLTKGTDYTVSYSGNTSIGKATVTIKGKGSYADKVSRTFTIKPPNVSVKFTGTTARTITVAWKKAAGGVKYQVAYKKKSSSTWKTVTVSSSGVSRTITGLTKGKTYQVRVRAVKTVSGRTYAGSWSSTASLKIAGRKTQSLKVSKKTVSLKYSKVKKAKQTVKAVTKVSGAKGTVTYTLLSVSSKASKFSVASGTGKITVKKGTSKGTYTLKILVSSSAKGSYGKTCKVVSVKVKVK